MTVGLSVADANAALDSSVLATYTWVKLHVGDPGAAGATNPATETTRHQATWRASSAGASSNSNTLTWTSVAASETYTHFSVWTASTAGSFGFSGTVSGGTVTAGGTWTVAVDDLDVSFPVAA